MPDAIAMTPWRSATPPLAQASSTRTAGIGTSPTASAMMGAMCACRSNRSRREIADVEGFDQSLGSKPLSTEARSS
jgi:hypothetical protein